MRLLGRLRLDDWVLANGRAVSLVAGLVVLVIGVLVRDGVLVAAGVVLIALAVVAGSLEELRGPGFGARFYKPEGQVSNAVGTAVAQHGADPDALAKALEAATGLRYRVDHQHLSPGFHAQWYARSADAAARPGGVVQCAAVYLNTGTEPWIKGHRAADLATVPIGDQRWASEGWALEWLTSDVFARQAPDLVAPGQLGSWSWRVQVPPTARSGLYVLNFQPVVWDTAIGNAAAIRITVTE